MLKSEDEAWGLFETLAENSLHHMTSSSTSHSYRAIAPSMVPRRVVLLEALVPSDCDFRVRLICLRINWRNFSQDRAILSAGRCVLYVLV